MIWFYHGRQNLTKWSSFFFLFVQYTPKSFYVRAKVNVQLDLEQCLSRFGRYLYISQLDLPQNWVIKTKCLSVNLLVKTVVENY